MPSETPRMARTMAKAAKDPEFAKRKGISQKVAQEFHSADKRKARREGGGKVFGAIRRKRKGTL